MHDAISSDEYQKYCDLHFNCCGLNVQHNVLSYKPSINFSKLKISYPCTQKFKSKFYKFSEAQSLLTDNPILTKILFGM